MAVRAHHTPKNCASLMHTSRLSGSTKATIVSMHGAAARRAERLRDGGIDCHAFHNLPRLARGLIYPLFMAGGLRDCLGVRAATACAHGRTHAASVTLDDSCVASHGVLLAIAREASGSPVCTHGDVIASDTL